MEVRSLLRRAAQYHRDREAVFADGRRLTFGEAWSRGLQHANLLLELGLRPGDRVGVLEDNCLAAADFYLGAAAAGLVRVPLYARDSVESNEHMLRKTECRALVVGEGHAEAAGRLAERFGPDLRIFQRDQSYEAILAEQSNSDPDPRIDPDDPFIIRFTA